MINNINSDSILNNPLLQQSEVSEISKKNSAKNPYVKSNDLVDQSEISDEAIALFQKEQDINKYKNMVLEALNSPETSDPIKNLVQNGEYKVSDEDLADSLMEDFGFINNFM